MIAIAKKNDPLKKIGIPTLSKNYVIRFWKGPPTHICLWNHKRGVYYDISEMMYELLILCDGSNNVEDIYKKISKIVDTTQSEFYSTLDRLSNEGIIDVMPFQIKRIFDIHKTNNVRIKSVLWHITSQCNLQCLHCYLGKQYTQDLPKEDMYKIIDCLYDANVLKVNISGGEPFLRRDFLKIIEYILNKNIRIDGILTNGTIISHDFLDLLNREDMNTIFLISLDASTENKHDLFRGQPDTWQKVIKNIKILLNNGFQVGINTSLTKINIKEIRNLYDLILRLGVNRWRIENPLPLGNWQRFSHSFGISLNDEMNAYKLILDLWKNDDRPIELELGHAFRYLGDKKANECYNTNSLICDYYADSCCILPNGDVTPCGSLIDNTYVFGNVLEHPIKDIWMSPKMRQIKEIRIKDLLKYDKNSKCESCNFLKFCGVGCRANSLKYGGDIMVFDPIMCSIFCDYSDLIDL